MKKTFSHLVVLLVLFLGSATLKAQVGEPESPGFDFNYSDSTSLDSGAVSEDQDGSDKSNEKTDPLTKPYERIVLTVDSTTNLITYSGVVEQEESGSDSLYLRTKRWAEKAFTKDTKVELDKRNQKLVYIAYIPAYSYLNKYTKRNIGKYEMKFTVLIKEGRYKYSVSNLVHESVKPAGASKANRNYFEFYYTSINNVRQYDSVLRAADKDIQALLASYREAMKEPKVVDEDDW
ncbi:MAG: DUF4468 domain-containing protein [Bacteroidetes bacterium]|nr:DUF4468 domain-containing protein [Bacteroidota bacterium]